MSRLIDIGRNFKTTKNRDGFLAIYDKYFADIANKKINILEIGIDDGESLRLWREYFPNANIVGLDIFSKDFKISGVKMFQGDQSNISDLKKVTDLYNNFDIIIDDGSHVSKQTIKSFYYLFDFLNENGFYVVEDLQTSYLPNFGGSRINLKKYTSMNFIKSLTDSINYELNDRPFFKKNKFDGNINFVHFFQNIAFIKKGKSNHYFYNKEIKNNFFNKLKKIISFFYK